MLTPEQFRDAMKEIGEKHAGDWEVIHSEADNLICALLREMGYEEGLNIYDSWTRWYA
jgi:hypothetical protein